MGTFIRKLIPANIAGILGIVQALIPLLREISIAGIRVVDILTPGRGLQPVIEKVGGVFNAVEKGFESFKNLFL